MKTSLLYNFRPLKRKQNFVVEFYNDTGQLDLSEVKFQVSLKYLAEVGFRVKSQIVNGFNY